MGFPDLLVEKVWQKASYSDPQNESSGFRKDQCGAWICWSHYGNRDSQYGWEIDHIVPVASGGSDHISNLRPLHWANNAAKADGTATCVVTSNGTTNVRLRRASA